MGIRDTQSNVWALRTHLRISVLALGKDPYPSDILVPCWMPSLEATKNVSFWSTLGA